MSAEEFVIHNAPSLDRFVALLRKTPMLDARGRPLVVRMERLVESRTLSQNSYLHKLFHILAEHTGSTDAEMKAAVKNELLPKVEWRNPITGEITLEPKGTSALDKQEMSVFIEKIHALAIQHFDITLPSSELRGMRE